MSSSDENSVSIASKNSSSSEDRRTLEQDQKIKSVLNDINCMTNNNFNSIEDCVPFVKKLYKESQTKPRREFNRAEYITKDSSSGGDKQRQLLQEIEAFQDQIEELESIQRTSDKKYTKKLKDKEAEIEVEEQKQKCTQLLKDETEKWTKLMMTKETQFKSQIAEMEKIIETKQRGMDTMKNKITEFKLTEDKMKTEMKELKKERDTETQKVKQLNELLDDSKKEIHFLKDKVKNCESEIKNLKCRRYQNNDLFVGTSMDPDFIKRDDRSDVVNKKKNENAQKACPNCQTMFYVRELREHLTECLNL